MHSLEEAKVIVASLVERFERNIEAYKNGSYNETQVRQEFINPFFEALGWDIDNSGELAEQYKEVIHEATIKIGTSTQSPDYCFRIGRERKFFLEAKKPSINIKGDPAPAYQLRRYAWSAKLPISILTNFKEFAVYECLTKPSPTDSTGTGRKLYLSFKDYPERFTEIYENFSREAVWKGSFDKYVQNIRGKRGTSEVDAEFLKEIEKWRLALARDLALRNPKLNVHELRFAVQQTIDRIVFLRIAEDRGIENYGSLQSLLNGSNKYRRLLELYDRADRKYNSGLFDFKADSLSHRLIVEDKVLKDIIGGLYPPKSPYEFSVIGPEILGSVYEQFLGKVIRLTPGHHAEVDTKPEVKKAGGVYYTPRFVVDYIVRNTVEKWLEGKKPKQVEALKVLDPACGSGTFLLGAYQCLLDWHLAWYVKDGPAKWVKGKTPALMASRGGGWRLTTSERKKILLNNIFGVDIDRQAVEVTKLSLLLKILEYETQGDLIGERLLPSLENNIKCGNSLIGPDFYKERTNDMFDDEERRRVNVFDWKSEFPEILKAGGFDCVIGNPPYVSSGLTEFKPYFQERYKTHNGSADLYVYFIEKGISLLKAGGLYGIICSNKWMLSGYGLQLRRWLKERQVNRIIDFGDLRVFQKVSTYPCIMLVDNERPDKSFHSVKVKDLSFISLEEYLEGRMHEVRQDGLDDTGWSVADPESKELFEKIKKKGLQLKDYVNGQVYYGVKTGLNEAFVIDADTRERLIKEDAKSKELIKPFLVGRDVKRYNLNNEKRFLILIPKGWTRNKAKVKDCWKWLKDTYPSIANYLFPFKVRAEKRYDKGEFWWELRACEYYAEFDKPKILWPGISAEVAAFAFDGNGFYGNDNTQLIISDDKYLLGILNSWLSRLFLKNICDPVQGGFYRLKIVYVQQLPIRPIDFNDKADAARHARMVSLVERMLDINKKLAASATPADRDLYKRQIDTTDKEIDNLVYELYGLTEEETRIVEASASSS